MKSVVIVSHSHRFAEGAVELMKMTNPDLQIAHAGGIEDGSLGTSYEKIKNAIESVYSAEGVMVIPDLGSSVMTAEMVIEELAMDGKTGVELSDLHLAEELTAISLNPDYKIGENVKNDANALGETVAFSYTLQDPVGLHARPAAELVKFCQKLDAKVTVTAKDKSACCTSLIEVLTLGAPTGTELNFIVSGENAAKAAAELEQFVRANL